MSLNHLECQLIAKPCTESSYNLVLHLHSGASTKFQLLIVCKYVDDKMNT